MMITISCAAIVKVHKTNLTFHYCSHMSSMRKAGAAACTEMLNPVITNGGPLPGDVSKLGL